MNEAKARPKLANNLFFWEIKKEKPILKLSGYVLPLASGGARPIYIFAEKFTLLVKNRS
jgi:hypothetical protein